MLLGTGGYADLLRTSGRPTGTNFPFTPLDIAFSPFARLRPYSPWSPVGNRQHKIAELAKHCTLQNQLWTTFSQGPGTAPTTSYTDAAVGVPAKFTTTYSSGSLARLVHIMPHYPGDPWGRTSITFTANGTAGTKHSAWVGLKNVFGNFSVGAKFDKLAGAHGRISLTYDKNDGGGEVILSGGTYDLLADPVYPATLTFTLTGPNATVHFGEPDQFIMIRRLETHIDSRNIANLSQYHYAFYTESDGAGNTMVLTDRIETGPFGYLGMTDLRPVQDIWGNTLQSPQGEIWLTVDAACYGPDAPEYYGWEDVHTIVFKFHPKTLAFTQVAEIYPTYLVGDFTGALWDPPGGYPSAAGMSDICLRYDPRDKTFSFTALGALDQNFSCRMVYAKGIKSNLLSGTHSRIRVKPLPLGSGSWLNACFYEDTQGRINLMVANSHPDLWRTYFRSPDGDLANLVQMDFDNTIGYGEGYCNLRIGDKNYMCGTFGYYDVSDGTMVHLGEELNIVGGKQQSGSAPAWPCLFDYYDEGETKYGYVEFISRGWAQNALTLGDGILAELPSGGLFVTYWGDRTIPGGQNPLANYTF